MFSGSGDGVCDRVVITGGQWSDRPNPLPVDDAYIERDVPVRLVQKPRSSR